MTDFLSKRSRACVALDQLKQIMYDDDNQAITEQLVNLMAYCDREGIKFDRKLEIARMQYSIEVTGEKS